MGGKALISTLESLESRIKDKKLNDALAIVRKEINSVSIVGDKELISERIKTLILYSIERIDYYEDYRTRCLTLSTQLLIFSVAFLTLVVNIVSPFPFLVIFGTLILFLMCVLNVGLYLKESVYPGYVHRSVSDVPWYYLYNLKRMNRETKRYTGKQDEQRKNYLLDLYENIRKRVKDTEGNRIKEDIEQMTILYVITAYKVRFSGRMRSLLSFGIISFGMFSGLQLLLSLF